jgi:hypothetical protein
MDGGSWCCFTITFDDLSPQKSLKKLFAGPIEESNCLARYSKLPLNAKDFIYDSTASYPTISAELERMWGRAIPKSTISYHKKSSPFRSFHYNAAGRDHDMSRLTDWEKGYITGFFAGDGSTRKPPSSQCRVIRFYLHKLRERLLAQHLASLLKKANLRPRLIFLSTKNILIVEVCSKALYEMICRYLSWEDHRKVYTVKLRSVCGLSQSLLKGL